MNLRIIYYIFFLAFLLMSCNGQSVKERTSEGLIRSTDSRGITISLSKPAKRVVVLFEPLVDEVYMLDAQDKLVGIPEQIYLNESTFHHLSKIDTRIKNKEIATPTFGGRSSNMETIVSLQPDLVIIYDQDQETIEQLEGLGIKTFAVSSLTKEKILDELKGVGTLLGKEDRANEIVSYINKELTHIENQQIKNPKTVYYAWSKGRVLSTSGKGTLVNMAIELAGAKNACPLELEAPNIGVELLYQWNPDKMILWNSNIADIYKLKELANLPAVKDRQVFVMEPPFYYDPHTVKFLLFAKQLRYWSYPEIYSKEMLTNDIQEAMEVFYGKRSAELL